MATEAALSCHSVPSSSSSVPWVVSDAVCSWLEMGKIGFSVFRKMPQQPESIHSISNIIGLVPVLAQNAPRLCRQWYLPAIVCSSTKSICSIFCLFVCWAPLASATQAVGPAQTDGCARQVKRYVEEWWVEYGEWWRLMTLAAVRFCFVDKNRIVDCVRCAADAGARVKAPDVAGQRRCVYIWKSIRRANSRHGQFKHYSGMGFRHSCARIKSERKHTPSSNCIFVFIGAGTIIITVIQHCDRSRSISITRFCAIHCERLFVVVVAAVQLMPLTLPSSSNFYAWIQSSKNYETAMYCNGAAKV